MSEPLQWQTLLPSMGVCAACFLTHKIHVYINISPRLLFYNHFLSQCPHANTHIHAHRHHPHYHSHSMIKLLLLWRKEKWTLFLLFLCKDHPFWFLSLLLGGSWNLAALLIAKNPTISFYPSPQCYRHPSVLAPERNIVLPNRKLHNLTQHIPEMFLKVTRSVMNSKQTIKTSWDK